MARINIDDQFWTDLLSVVASLGNQDVAIGQAVRFFKLAQEKHKHGKLITEAEFARAGFSEALIGPFADRVDGGIQAVGAQKHFGWLAKRVEAGRIGGKQSKPKQTKAKRTKAKQPEASPSYSYSSSSSSSCLNTIAPASQDAGEGNASKVYIDCYKGRYGHDPKLAPKHHGILKRFRESYPKDWPGLIEGYFKMPDSFAVQRSHPVELLETKINEITRFLATGKVVTKKVIQHAEEIIDKAQGTDRKPRRSLEEMEAEREQMLLEAGKEESA